MRIALLASIGAHILIFLCFSIYKWNILNDVTENRIYISLVNFAEQGNVETVHASVPKPALKSYQAEKNIGKKKSSAAEVAEKNIPVRESVELPPLNEMSPLENRDMSNLPFDNIKAPSPTQDNYVSRIFDDVDAKRKNGIPLPSGPSADNMVGDVFRKDLPVNMGGKNTKAGNNPYGEPTPGNEDIVASGDFKRPGGGSGLVEGPASARSILYREDFRVPGWVEEKGIETAAKIKFWVLADGSIEKVMVSNSTGYQELDDIILGSIKRWKFSKLPDHYRDNVQWGVIAVKIKLR